MVNRHYSALFEADRGMALLNRAIWGISCLDGDLALTLLHAPTVPDDTCDRGPQHFEFAVSVYDRPFAAGQVVPDGYAFNNAPIILPGAAGDRTGCWAENAVIETVKPPMEGGAGTVLRLWEHRGTMTRATLHLPARGRVYDCGLQENRREPVGEGDTIALTLKPFQIMTLMIE